MIVEYLQHLGINLILCLVGLAGYSLFSVRNHLHDFDKEIFLKHNKVFWIWAGAIQTLYVLVMSFYPGLEKILAVRIIAGLEGLTGQNLGIPEEFMNVVVYLTMTWQLSRLANRSISKKNKIGTNKEH